MPKPDHLSWEEAASPGLVNSTAYRQLVSQNGAGMKQGDNVLIWGASGGLGSYATQFALAGGANPICVVSSPEKADICRAMGATAVIDRNAEGYKFWKDEHTQDPREWKRFGSKIRELTGGEDIDIVFEHPGRETFGASVYVTRKGGTITTCASTSGYMHQYDNRYLWMSLKRIVGSHFANYREAWEANRLIAKGKIHPTLSKVYSLEETGQAAYDVHRNLHQARSASSRSPPRRASASATTRCAPNTSTRSTASATSETVQRPKGQPEMTERQKDRPCSCGRTPATPRPRRPTSCTAATSPRARPACRSRSTCRRRPATTPTTSSPAARSAGSGSRSPTWATCGGCSRTYPWSR